MGRKKSGWTHGFMCLDIYRLNQKEKKPQTQSQPMTAQLIKRDKKLKSQKRIKINIEMDVTASMRKNKRTRVRFKIDNTGKLKIVKYTIISKPKAMKKSVKELLWAEQRAAKKAALAAEKKRIEAMAVMAQNSNLLQQQLRNEARRDKETKLKRQQNKLDRSFKQLNKIQKQLNELHLRYA